jgi:hypothetical protein
MICPDAGRWRAWLDCEADDEATALANHLAACPTCRSTVSGLQATANSAVAALASLAPANLPAAADIALAQERLAWRRDLARVAPVARPAAATAPEPTVAQPVPQEVRSMSRRPLFRRWRVAVAGLAAALALTVLVGTDEGRTATAQFLSQFRSQRFAVVTIEPGRERGYLAQLGNLGTIEGGQRSRANAETVVSVAEASQRVGFPVKQPDPATLPAGLGTTPAVQVWSGSEFRFTLDRAKALAHFRATGHPEFQIPERFDGAALVVSIPPAAFVQYTGAGNNRTLMIGQARELDVGVEGNVTLAELRDFLLGLPGLPPETVRQLRAIEDWRSTLPIPVPVDQVAWQQTTIAGGPGLLLADNSGIGSGALWQRDGRVYGVAGTARATEIQRVADNLR